MSEINEQLERLSSLKEVNLGNLGLLEADPSPQADGSIRLSGVVRDPITKKLTFVDHDGTEVEIQTVEATTGFSRFVFDVDGQFSLVADSAKDSILFLGEHGIKIRTDPSQDAMIMSVDATTVFQVVGSGSSMINPAGELRTLTAGNNLLITELATELNFDVDLSWVPVGLGLNPYAGLTLNGQPQIRSFNDSDTVKFTLEADGLTLSLEAIPNVEAWGSAGVVMMMIDPINGTNTAKIRNIEGRNNIRISTDVDGQLVIESLQAFANHGSGIALVAQGPNDTLDIKTINGGGGTSIIDDGSGTLLISSETQLDNVGTGAPISFTDSGRGKLRSIKSGLGMQVNQTANEIELQADVRSQNTGAGAPIGNVTAGGMLELKTLAAADASVVINDPGDGTLTLKANHDDYIIDGRLDDALDGSGDPYHLILDTHEGHVIDAGPIPYLRAEYDATLEEITVYNRNTLVGVIPDQNPAVTGLDAIEGDYQAGSALYWDFTMDFAEPNNEILFLDLEL